MIAWEFSILICGHWSLTSLQANYHENQLAVLTYYARE